MKKSFTKSLLSVSLLTLSGVALQAAPLSPEEALGRLLSEGSSRLSPKDTPVLLSTIKAPDNLPAIYVFRQGENGSNFFISADDLAPALLGYTNGDAFSQESLSPQLKWWLDTYAGQIEYNRENLNSEGEPARVAYPEGWTNVEPLLTTQWNQSAPYWDLCPELNGERCVVGCVGTAMAQVIKYFEYPEKASGLISYKPMGFGSNIKMSLSSENLDYSNMLDNYIPGNYTDEEAHAVAFLSAACAFSVRMIFNPESSGAYAFDIPGALINNFKYDKGIRYLERDFYTYNEWAGMIYDNLISCGPVLYGGQSEEGGHQFVCDGYSGDGYFHFNWGWGGISDGYFLLDALNPLQQGIGGALGGFHFAQDIIIGIRPDTGAENPEQANFNIYGSMNASVEGDDLVIGSEERLYLVSGLYKDAYFNLGFEVVNTEDPEDVQYISTDYTEIELPAYYSVILMRTEENPEGAVVNLLDLNLKEGVEYKFILSTLNLEDENAVWTPVGVASGGVNYVYVTLNDGIYSVRNIPEGNLEVTNLDIPDTIYYGKKTDVDFELYNPSEIQITRKLCVVIINEEWQVYLRSGFLMKTLDPGETEDVNFSAEFSLLDPRNKFEPGTYYMTIMDFDTFGALIQPVEVTVLSSSQDDPSQPEDPGDEEGSVDSIELDNNGLFNVVNLSGNTVMKTSDKNDLLQLPKGVYIVNGKKIIR